MDGLYEIVINILRKHSSTLIPLLIKYGLHD
jgi:hypothetical protein